MTRPEAVRDRIALFAIGGLLALMAAFELTRGPAFNIVVGLLLLAAAVGLLRRRQWGRRATIVFMWLLLVFAVGDSLPARIEADEALGREPATATELIIRLAVLCAAALASLHFLQSRKAHFRTGW